MRVYLDSNVVIGAGKRPEHHRLKGLAVSGTVTLYASPTVWHEQRKRSREASEQPLSDDWRAAATALRNRQTLERREEAERAFWHPAILQYPKCTFEGIVACIAAGWTPPDLTGELALYSELIGTHRIGHTDAIHLMIAHSAGTDWFLTWEEKTLIRRAAAAKWLGPTPATPEDFLAIIGP